MPEIVIPQIQDGSYLMDLPVVADVSPLIDRFERVDHAIEGSLSKNLTKYWTQERHHQKNANFNTHLEFPKLSTHLLGGS